VVLSFSNFPNPASRNSIDLSWDFLNSGVTANRIVVVPEPGMSVTIMGLGAAMLLRRRGRRA
jgi:hypothetical protein